MQQHAKKSLPVLRYRYFPFFPQEKSFCINIYNYVVFCKYICCSRGRNLYAIVISLYMAKLRELGARTS